MADDASSLTDALADYATHLRALARSPRTVHAHVARLRRFFDFAEKHAVKHPADVTQAVLLDYQKHLADYVNERGTSNSIAVQNQHLTVVAGFFRYLRQTDRLAHNPAAELEYARQPKRLPRSVPNETDMKRLLSKPDTSTVLGFRDRTILEVLYSTGIRKQELINLSLEDVDLDSGFLMVREGKGGKDRVVPLGKVAARFIETYLHGIRPDLLAQGPDAKCRTLFLSARGTRLGKNTVNEIVARYVRAAGFKQPISPHSFRHAFATHLIRHNANIRHVQEMLGHGKLSSTQTYIRLTLNDLKEAHSRFHPREKMR